MKTYIAILMGSCSGLLIAIMGSWVFFGLNFGRSEATILVLGCFVGGWIVSSCFLLIGARAPSKVLARGFLLGGAEWLLMIGGGVIRASRMETMDSAGMMVTESAIVPLFMVALCLIGYTIVQFWRRAMKPEQSTPGKALDMNIAPIRHGSQKSAAPQPKPVSRRQHSKKPLQIVDDPLISNRFFRTFDEARHCAPLSRTNSGAGLIAVEVFIESAEEPKSAV